MLNEEFVSREVKEKLAEYQKILLKWNKKINLISRNDEDNIWPRHFQDSIQLLRYIKNLDIHVVDLGSGAGFPGMILSIAGVKRVTLIESDQKKAIFLLLIAKLSGNEIRVVNERIENIEITADIVTSRALASVDNIFSLSRKIQIRDKYLLLKGSNYIDELTKAKIKWQFDYKLHDSTTDKAGKIIEITNLKYA